MDRDSSAPSPTTAWKFTAHQCPVVSVDKPNQIFSNCSLPSSIPSGAFQASSCPTSSDRTWRPRELRFATTRTDSRQRLSVTMHLLECSEDVLRLILGYLSRADLHAVCLVHPLLGRLAEPLLYDTIKFTFRDSFRAGKVHPPIASLVGNILRRPERAAYVRTILCKKYRHYEKGWNGKVPKIFPVHESDLQQALSVVENTRLPYRDTWMEELRKGTLDAYLAVLLSQLPRLRHLHLGPVFFTESDLIGLTLRSILCDSHSDCLTPGSSLHQLQTVTLERIRERATWKVRNTANVLPFFYLPSLREMSVSIDNPLGSVFPWPVQPPSTLGLSSLRLKDLRESHLGDLLSATPHLRSLHWIWGFHLELEDQFNSPVISLDQLMLALAHVRGTLTELTIPAFCSHPHYTPFPLRAQGSAKALAGFERLKKLFIPLVFFTGFSVPVREELASCLPRSLEELTLTDDLFGDDFHEQWNHEAAHTRAVGAWLANVNTSTPRLRKLYLVLQSTDNEVGLDVLDARNEIRELTSCAGIELKIEHAYDYEGLLS